KSRASDDASSMREVRGVRSLAAALMSLAKAKSVDIGLCHDVWRLHAKRLRGAFNRRRFSLQQRQHLVAGTVGHEAAVVEQQQAIDHVEQGRAMRGDDDRHRSLAQGLQPLEEFGFAANVEMR